MFEFDNFLVYYVERDSTEALGYPLEFLESVSWTGRKASRC